MSQDNDSPADRERVGKAITWAIVAFFKRRLATGQAEFKADDLRRYVREQVGDAIAPASPDRIMRHLRHGGTINYELVSRSESRYRVTGA